MKKKLHKKIDKQLAKHLQKIENKMDRKGQVWRDEQIYIAIMDALSAGDFGRAYQKFGSLWWNIHWKDDDI